jgi:hypothetical protein
MLEITEDADSLIEHLVTIVVNQINQTVDLTGIDKRVGVDNGKGLVITVFNIQFIGGFPFLDRILTSEGIVVHINIDHAQQGIDLTKKFRGSGFCQGQFFSLFQIEISVNIVPLGQVYIAKGNINLYAPSYKKGGVLGDKNTKGLIEELLGPGKILCPLQENIFMPLDNRCEKRLPLVKKRGGILFESVQSAYNFIPASSASMRIINLSDFFNIIFKVRRICH